MNLIPLLPTTDPHTPLAYRDGQPISRAQFLAQVHALAASLPTDGPVLNLCQDRYWFAVALFAAVVRDRLTVLPNASAPEHLASVAAAQPGLLVLSDLDESPAPGLPHFDIRPACAQARLTDAPMPLIPFAQRIACVYTSGSTGAPAPHYKTFGRLQRAILAGAERVWRSAGGPCSVIATVPIRHMYGLESSVLLPLLGGGRLATDIPFFPADIADSLAQMPAPRLLVITPFHLHKLLEAEVTLPPIATLLSATAPLSAELAQQAEQRLQCPVLEIYGSTETGQMATRRPAEDSIWHTLPGITISARDGEFWADGEVYDTPQMLNDSIELHDPCTFRLLDRKANMLNVAGKRSSLTYLNHLITSLPGVEDAVFCVPARGPENEVERLAAFVVAPTLNRATLLQALRAHIDPVFLPRPIVFVDHLPRDGNGKILARALNALIAQHIHHPEAACPNSH